MTIRYASNYDLTIPFSDTSIQMALATGVAQTYNVPGDATKRYSVRFAYTPAANVFVRLNAAPAAPGAGAATTQAYSELRPGDDGSQRYVNGGDVLHFITPDASAYVGISLREIS